MSRRKAFRDELDGDGFDGGHVYARYHRFVAKDGDVALPFSLGMTCTPH